MGDRLRLSESVCGRGNHTHSFSSITFSVSQCVRPLKDTLGFSCGRNALRGFNIQRAAHVSLAEVNINKTKKIKPNP